VAKKPADQRSNIT